MRTELVLEMKKIAIAVEAHHHEVETGGQGEIDMQFAPLRQSPTIQAEWMSVPVLHARIAINAMRRAALFVCDAA